MCISYLVDSNKTFHFYAMIYFFKYGEASLWFEKYVLLFDWGFFYKISQGFEMDDNTQAKTIKGNNIC